jgi:hypothetical protein
MSAPERSRTLADMAREDAPLPARRAASVLLAVAREAERRAGGGVRMAGFTASQVTLCADGSVRIDQDDPTGHITARDDDTAGTSIGRLLFELLVGRPPLDRDDALQPFLTSSLPPEVVGLLARSCSDAPGQWPEVAEWREALGALAGGQAMGATARERAARRWRRVVLAVALAVLVAITVAVLVLSPRWWDSATRDEDGMAAVPAHFVDRS